VNGKKDTEKAKGIKSNVVARSIMFNDYAFLQFLCFAKLVGPRNIKLFACLKSIFFQNYIRKIITKFLKDHK
ncbi:hypothetical protein ALC53_12545, partial [Atta colombica]